MSINLDDKLNAEYAFWIENQKWFIDVDDTININTNEILDMLYLGRRNIELAIELGSGPIPSLRSDKFRKVLYIDPLINKQINLIADRLNTTAYIIKKELFSHKDQDVIFINKEFPELGEYDSVCNNINIIVSRNGLDHVFNIYSTLDKIHLILKEGGILVIPHCHIFDYADDHKNGIIQWGRILNDSIDHAHPWTWSESGFRNLLKEHGFIFEGIRYENKKSSWPSYMKGIAKRISK